MRPVKPDFYDVNDVMTILGIGKNKAYEIMQKINKEVEKYDGLSVPGRVYRKAFETSFDLHKKFKPEEEEDAIDRFEREYGI